MLKGTPFAVALMVMTVLWAGGTSAQSGRLLVELNKFEGIENGCRTFFLFRNATDIKFKTFEMSLAILDRNGIIERLLTVEAAPLPSARTTLKLFEIPETQCDGIGEILLHEIVRCDPDQGEAPDCFAIIDLKSRASAPLVK